MGDDNSHNEGHAPESEVEDAHNPTAVDTAAPVLTSDSQHQTVPLTTANLNPVYRAPPEVQTCPDDPISNPHPDIDLTGVDLGSPPTTTSDPQTDNPQSSSYWQFADCASWQNTTADPQTDNSPSTLPDSEDQPTTWSGLADSSYEPDILDYDTFGTDVLEGSLQDTYNSQPEAANNPFPTSDQIPVRTASAHAPAAGGPLTGSNTASGVYSNLLAPSVPQPRFASAADRHAEPLRRLAHRNQRLVHPQRTSTQSVPFLSQREQVVRTQGQPWGRRNRAQASSSNSGPGPASRQEDPGTMPQGPDDVYRYVIEETFTALASTRQPSTRHVYQLFVHNLVQFIVNNRLPNRLQLVNRTNFEIAVTQAIIRATSHPQQYTRAVLDHLQEVGLFILDEEARNGALWHDETEVMGMTFSATALRLDRDRYLGRIGNRNWRVSWVQGTLIDNRPDNDGGSEDGTVDNTRDREPRLRRVGENDSNLSSFPNGVLRLSKSPPASNSRRSAKRPPAKSAQKKRAPGARRTKGTNARVAARDDPSNPLTERTSNNQTTWATNMGGRLVEFASHIRGRPDPWDCLLGDTFTTNERGQLTKHLQHLHEMDPADLAHMQLDNARPSNFEGHDDKDWYVYGEFVHGDPGLYKCLLCKKEHKGCQVDNSFTRHMRNNHGIGVQPPPITTQEVDRHHQKKVKSGAWARQLAALESLEERRNAAAAQAAADQAGLALSLVGGGAGVKRSASEAGLDDEDDVEEEDDIALEDWLARATGAYREDGEEE
ncbi:hypothetical protein H2200_004284 [Cladophialophora chaetospira]|uniref:Uncharacterized protein n=1 Tax=Cladophialophora chaetospira TaxID=386627 RepID=A0AA39CKC1_9EURO|nr:hypothetical protein H2200_004284 [Cladophialophora chaetospira]